MIKNRYTFIWHFLESNFICSTNAEQFKSNNFAFHSLVVGTPSLEKSNENCDSVCLSKIVKVFFQKPPFSHKELTCIKASTNPASLSPHGMSVCLYNNIVCFKSAPIFICTPAYFKKQAHAIMYCSVKEFFVPEKWTSPQLCCEKKKYPTPFY